MAMGTRETDQPPLWVATSDPAAAEDGQRSKVSLEVLGAEEQDLLSQLADVGAEQARLSRHIAEVDRTQSELETLLSRLQGHVHDGICPMCGEDHRSENELLGRIQARVTADAAAAARADLTNVHDKSKRLSERVAANRETRDKESARQTRLARERVKLADEIERFDNAVGTLGVAVGAASQTTAEELLRRRDQIQKEMAESRRQAQEGQEKVQATQARLAGRREAIAATASELAGKEAAFAGIEREVSRLREDPRFAQIPLNIEAEELIQLQGNNVDEIDRLGGDMAAAEAAVTRSKQLVDSLRHETNALKTVLPADGLF